MKRYGHFTATQESMISSLKNNKKSWGSWSWVCRDKHARDVNARKVDIGVDSDHSIEPLQHTASRTFLQETVYDLSEQITSLLDDVPKINRPIFTLHKYGHGSLLGNRFLTNQHAQLSVGEFSGEQLPRLSLPASRANRLDRHLWNALKTP